VTGYTGLTSSSGEEVAAGAAVLAALALAAALDAVAVEPGSPPGSREQLADAMGPSEATATRGTEARNNERPLASTALRPQTPVDLLRRLR
jgi:hypothetical protein